MKTKTLLSIITFIMIMYNAMSYDLTYSQSLKMHTRRVSSMVFDKIGTTLASGSWDKTINIWIKNELNQWVWSQTLKKHTSIITSIAFSPDGKTLISGSFDKTIRIWIKNELNKWVFSHELKSNNGKIYSVAFHPNGKLFAFGCENGTIELCVKDDSKNRITLKIKTTPSAINSLAFSFDEKTLVAGDNSGHITIYEISIDQGDIIQGGYATVPANRSAVRSVAFGPNGKILVSGGDDIYIMLWEKDNNNDWYRTRKLAGGRQKCGDTYSVAVSSDGKIIASGGIDKNIKIFWENGDRRWVSWLPGHPHPITSVAISPDGKTLASGCSASGGWKSGCIDDCAIKIWEILPSTPFDSPPLNLKQEKEIAIKGAPKAYEKQPFKDLKFFFKESLLDAEEDKK